MFRRAFNRRWYSPLPRVVRHRPVPRAGRTTNAIYDATPSRGANELGSTRSIIQPHHPVATTILNEPTVVIERQIEMMNVFLGFEQANKYVIMDALGNRIGYMQERDFSIAKAVMRQFYRLHRPFVVDVFDNWGNLLLTIKRPFSWINSHIKAILPDDASPQQSLGSSSVDVAPFGSGPVPKSTSTFGEGGILVGESVQNWHLWRRRYELFEREAPTEDSFSQFAEIDAPFLSFEFALKDEVGKTMGGVDRNWVGLGRELFTDTGVYIVRMDSQQSLQGVLPAEIISDRILNLDQRAVLLANAVSIDFDYFSRHSRHGGGFIGFGDYGE
ncbi:Aim25p [Lachancea thermotolerans CBS 6340]|uniref:Phospholipid scramblase n=1 Tax=Lachancea thermotolerans (strain ATCC 56472 / CBS 6340 / NRRL Y-8284) TaxID=559295 RepID=C5DH78_LACTC|nr:KLTH0E02002p [Lachancea thermotolerans CBS 6340]CAR23139.1 KLTH0E02002p [Lachancea thermotolerans CBS 6340]